MYSNIDRLLAIWQTLNQDQWIDKDQGSTDPLYPFHNGQGDKQIFKSDDVKVWTEFGYQYQLLHKHTDESQQQYLQRIQTWLAQNYNIGSTQVVKHAHKIKAIVSQHGATDHPTLQVQPAKATTSGTTEPSPDQKYQDFIIDLLYC